MHFKRILNSQQFENIFYNNKVIFISSITKTLPKNFKIIFITKSSCIAFFKQYTNYNFVVKFPIFFLLLKGRKNLKNSDYLENFLVVKKINNIIVFIKILNLYFLNFKKSFILLAYFTIVKFFFHILKNNFFKNSIFSLFYV